VGELFVVCVVSCRDPFMDHHEEKLHFWMTESVVCWSEFL
jgi:hypothetical protein